MGTFFLYVALPRPPVATRLNMEQVAGTVEARGHPGLVTSRPASPGRSLCSQGLSQRQDQGEESEASGAYFKGGAPQISVIQTNTVIQHFKTYKFV